MDKRTREEKNEEIFTLYPDVDKIYVTPNDKAFFNHEKASSYAGSADKVETYKRPPVKDAVDNLDKIKNEGDDPELDALKAKYKEAAGKAAHHTWDAAKIQEKLDAIEAEAGGSDD